MEPASLVSLLAASRVGEPARVLVVDPCPATRERLGRLLKGQVAGEAASVDGAMQAVAAIRPTVIVTAAALEDEPDAGLRLAAEAAAVDPNLQTVLYTADLPADLDARARREAVLVIRTDDRPSALLTAVRAANDIYRVLASERGSAQPEADVQAAYPQGGRASGTPDVPGRRPGGPEIDP